MNIVLLYSLDVVIDVGIIVVVVVIDVGIIDVVVVIDAGII